MPPRSSLTSSFSVTDANNEVVCPLRNQDGSSCRKRCLGEKRYRSMQEHIRRAHPEHYISKLPATEESFQLMINTPPSERPPPQPSSSIPQQGYSYDTRHYYGEDSSPGTPRNYDEFQSASYLPAASAAAALAQLHTSRIENEWDSGEDWMSDTEAHKQAMRNTIELPPLHANHIEPTSDPFSHFNVHRRRELLPSILSTSPPGRSSTLPPLQRSVGPNRPRKESLSKRASQPQHKRQKSKGENAYLKRFSQDRKAYSAEPSSALAAYGKRWEDLIDAATSATEDVDDERTPVPPSPISVNRASLPPFTHTNSFQSYQASPLQQALTPPSYAPDVPEPFPSVESGGVYNIEAAGLSDSSPSFSSQAVQIYCAACQGVSLLKDSFACTECICGICPQCADVLVGDIAAKRPCPRCASSMGTFRPFQLDIR